MNVSYGIIALFMFGLVIIFIFAGMWVYATMGLAGIIIAYFITHNLGFTSFVPYNANDKWVLTAIPLYLFMGNVLLESGVSSRLYRGASYFLSRFPGGLLHTNVGACAIFSTITGSALACCATISAVAIPEMRKRGYDKRLTAGSLAVSGTLGALIPPSIGFIIYGVMTDQSIGRLFFAGLFPGLLMALLFMVWIYIYALGHPAIAPSGEMAAEKGTFKQSVADLTPIFIVIVIVLGGLYMGLFSATEAGAVGCILALALAAFYRNLNWTIIHKSGMGAVLVTAYLQLIYTGASIMSNVIGELKIASQVAQLIVSIGTSPLMIFIIICLVLIILGMFMESLPVMIMTLPIFYPVISGLGYDPIWFGVIVMILILEGLVTPPVGLNLFIVQGMMPECTFGDIVKGALPFIIIAHAEIVILYLFPAIATWLPTKMIAG